MPLLAQRWAKTMSLHAAQSGSAVGGLLEGFLSGAQKGADFRRQRTIDQQVADEIQRRTLAGRTAAERAVVVEGQEDAEAARRGAEFQLETGLAPGAAPGPPTRVTPAGAPQGLMENVDRLRRGTGAALLDPNAAPAGFHRVGPSADERERTEEDELGVLVGQYIQDPSSFDISDPTNLRALRSAGLLDDELRRRTDAAAPEATSPLQRFEGQGGGMFTFDPRGEPGERVSPLTFEGEQLRGRRPADNFARSNAQTAMQAISRIDPFDFPDTAAAEAEATQIARRFGFDSVEQARQILAEAVSGGTPEDVDVEARTRELKDAGLSDDEIIARLRSEGLIQDG